MRYFAALRHFCPGQVFKDFFVSSVTVLFCIGWVFLAPLLALFEMFRPGVLDRKIFEWSRSK